MPSLIQKHAHVKGQRSNHHIFKFQPNPSWAKKRPNRYTSFSPIKHYVLFKRTTKVQISLHTCEGRSAPLLFIFKITGFIMISQLLKRPVCINVQQRVGCCYDKRLCSIHLQFKNKFFFLSL